MEPSLSVIIGPLYAYYRHRAGRGATAGQIFLRGLPCRWFFGGEQDERPWSDAAVTSRWTRPWVAWMRGAPAVGGAPGAHGLMGSDRVIGQLITRSDPHAPRRSKPVRSSPDVVDMTRPRKKRRTRVRTFWTHYRRSLTEWEINNATGGWKLTQEPSFSGRLTEGCWAKSRNFDPSPPIQGGRSVCAPSAIAFTEP